MFSHYILRIISKMEKKSLVKTKHSGDEGGRLKMPLWYMTWQPYSLLLVMLGDGQSLCTYCSVTVLVVQVVYSTYHHVHFICTGQDWTVSCRTYSRFCLFLFLLYLLTSWPLFSLSLYTYAWHDGIFFISRQAGNKQSASFPQIKILIESQRDNKLTYHFESI